MASQVVQTSYLTLSEAPAIPGLRFRTFQSERDFPGMLAVINAARKADQEERYETLEDMTNNYAHLTNCDPRQDVLIAEIEDQIVAYSRLTWWILDGVQDHIFFSFGYILPEWRHRGLGTTMLRFNQRRLREIAARPEHQNRLPAGLTGLPASRFFESFATSFQPGNRALLEGDGYTAIRYANIMVRPTLDDIPELPLPEGLEVRPVQPEQYRQIWDASQEAFRDHWGYVTPSEEDFIGWQKSAEFQPDLWQVAWDGEQIAGMVLNFINHAENQRFGRKRGYTEGISVRRPWRRRGLARALLASSLKVHRAAGMTETGLGVDSENPNGALRLYEDMGYKTIRTITTYRKPLE